MPQLLSRMDDVGWLTPSIAEVLDELPLLPYDEKFRREQAVTLQKCLSDLGVPCRVIRVGVFPSHTLYVMQPGGGRRRVVQQRVTQADIAPHLPAIQQALEAEAVGLVPELSRAPDYIGLLVKMADNQPLRLRNLLLMPTFQSIQASTALALGLDLEQQAVVRDMAALSHLLLVGETEAAGAVLRALLLNLLLFNTPADVRLALMSPVHDDQARALDAFIGVPHILGSRLRDTEESLKLLTGFASESVRREQLLALHGAADLEAYNAAVSSTPEKRLPRIVIVLEDILRVDWLAVRQRWVPQIKQIATAGPAVGLHLLTTAYTDAAHLPPDDLQALFPGRLLLRSAADIDQLWTHRMPFPAQFVEGFLVEGDSDPVPLLFGRVASAEIGRIAAYWQQVAHQRTMEHQLSAAAQPLEGDVSLPEAPEVPSVVRMPVPPPPTPEALIRAAEALTPEELKQARARALAAYLGWLGIGPLRDVLYMNEQEAQAMIAHLQAEGVLEAGDGPIWRFIRLDDQG